MPGKNHAYLQRQLERGDCLLGQVRISGRYILHHRDEAESVVTKAFRNPHDAIEIARYDDAGKYRPLKTAPNLRHGWQLKFASIEEVLLALDFLYPAAIGIARYYEADLLEPVALRATLDRQSGMYAVVKKITGEQAGDLIRETCNPDHGCLKKILWPIEPGLPSPLTVLPESLPTGEAEIPLPCSEACNILVAGGRKVVKASDKHSSH